MAFKEINEGVSDDGQSFVRIIEDDDILHEDNVDEHTDENESPIDTILKKIDVSTLPEEQKALFKELTETIKGRSSKDDSVETQNSTVEVLKQMVAQLQDLKKPKENADDAPPKKKLAESLTFEKDDFYAPYFKQVASALDLLIEKQESLETARNEDKRQSFQEKAVSFIKSNNLSSKVVAKMDEIAKTMGSGVYNDLPRLVTLAKSELGIRDVPKKKEIPDRKNVFEFRGRRKSESNVDQKPAKTMQEAWDMALDQLAGGE